MDEEKRFERGMQVRRTVLGDAHVERAQSNTNEFNAEFQELITRYAWGEIWTRPGLDHPTRRLLTIAMMIALNREEEFRLHVRAALAHGVSKETIKEVILQSAIYCGLPAANSAFAAASAVMEETP